MEGKENFPKRILNATRLIIDRITPKQLRGQNLNPNEGSLRASAMPEKFMNIPDTPPIHDDTLPEK